MIEKTTTIDEKTTIFDCRCEKTGILTKRIRYEDFKPGAVEAALCDAEIEKLKKFMGDKIKTDCWCRHLDKYIGHK